MENFPTSSTSSVVRTRVLTKSCSMKKEGGIFKSDRNRKRVQEVIRLYREKLDQLRKKDVHGENRAYELCLAAGALLQREGISMDTIKRVGAVPGVEIGDKFQLRAEMKMIGLHCQYMAGVDYTCHGHTNLAISIVASYNRYSNYKLSSDVLIYSGHGGNPNVRSRSQVPLRDQKLEGGNLALLNSIDAMNPVRVVLSKKADDDDDEGRHVYVYDGLYTVESVWQERGEFGKLVFKFKLIRRPGQPRVNVMATISSPRVKLKKKKEIVIKNDISEGKEGIQVSVVNGWDDERPSPFNYIANMVGWCNCKNNAINIPIKFQFEVFRTQDFNGWGLRSRQYIPSGSFICEYVGEYKQVRLRSKDDGIMYQMDIGGVSGGRSGCYSMIIDATQYGNLGRFINNGHPGNLRVDKVNCCNRVTRVLIYAAKDIPPRREMILDIN